MHYCWRIFSGTGDHYKLRSGHQVLLRIGLIGKDAGTFDNNIYLLRLPGQASDISDAMVFYRFFINEDRVTLNPDAPLILSINAVVFEKISGIFNAHQVIDTH